MDLVAIVVSKWPQEPTGLRSHDSDRLRDRLLGWLRVSGCRRPWLAGKCFPHGAWIARNFVNHKKMEPGSPKNFVKYVENGARNARHYVKHDENATQNAKTEVKQ